MRQRWFAGTAGKKLIGGCCALVALVLGSAVDASARDRKCPAPKAGASSPFGGTPCPGVRPGAPLRIALPVGSTTPEPICTLAFMLKAGADRYMSTAGHCTGLLPGEKKTWAAGDGPEVSDRHGSRIGTVAYAALGGMEEPDVDFALIRLDRHVKARPNVCHFGGPTGLNTDVVKHRAPLAVHYYGNTIAGGYVPVARQWLLPARTGFSTGLPDERRVLFTGHASFFDSGAPVLSSDGRALGILTGPGQARAHADDPTPYAGTVNALRLTHLVEGAEAALGVDLRLATASRS